MHSIRSISFYLFVERVRGRFGIAYGIATGINSGTVESADGKYNIAEAPLYFVRSGEAAMNVGGIWQPGATGYQVSSRANATDASHTYYFALYPSEVHPSNGSSRYYGHPLRCLARL